MLCTALTKIFGSVAAWEMEAALPKQLLRIRIDSVYEKDGILSNCQLSTVSTLCTLSRYGLSMTPGKIGKTQDQSSDWEGN